METSKAYSMNWYCFAANICCTKTRYSLCARILDIELKQWATHTHTHQIDTWIKRKSVLQLKMVFKLNFDIEFVHTRVTTRCEDETSIVIGNDGCVSVRIVSILRITRMLPASISRNPEMNIKQHFKLCHSIIDHLWSNAAALWVAIHHCAIIQYEIKYTYIYTYAGIWEAHIRDASCCVWQPTQNV